MASQAAAEAAASTSVLPKIYTLDQIEEAISSSPSFHDGLIHGIKRGFLDYSAGNFNACPIQTMGAPPMAPFDSSNPSRYSAQVCVKSGYLTGAPYHVIKVASGGYPFENSGLLQLYSQKTGKLEALLLDEGVLTELRTAAAGAVAFEACFSSSFPRSKIDCIGMLGTGVQARYQLRMLERVLDCRTVLVYGRTQENVDQFCKYMTREGWDVRMTKEPNELLEKCHVVVTTTSARAAVLGSEFDNGKRKRPQHITCIGADAPGKHELDPSFVAQSNLLVADSKLQTQERGEFQIALQQNLISLNDVVELGDLLCNRKQQEEPDLSIFDSSGVVVQDCVVAQLVYDLLSQTNKK